MNFKQKLEGLKGKTFRNENGQFNFQTSDKDSEIIEVGDDYVVVDMHGTQSIYHFENIKIVGLGNGPLDMNI